MAIKPDPYQRGAYQPSKPQQSQSQLVMRALKRIQSGQAYTKASVKRLASAGVNIGNLLRDTPGNGLPGAQAGLQTLKQLRKQKRQNG